MMTTATEPSSSALSPTEKRNLRGYIGQMCGAFALYAVALTLMLVMLQRVPNGPWRYAAALIPMAPVALIPIIVLRFVRKADELWRRIHLEALAFAFAVGMLLVMSYGFLQIAGAPAVNWIWVWPVFATCWCIGLVIARARYR